MPSLTIKDETTAGQTLRSFVIDVLTERLTVRELIRSRVYQEVDDFNARKLEEFQGLVEPRDAERTRRGWRLKTPRQIEWRPQFEQALEAFERRGILVLVNDRQATSLDEEVVVKPGTKVSFLRLVPLVGG